MQFRYVATGVVLALALAGCQRTSNTSSYADLPAQPSRPAPLQAQPVQGVQGGQLPPPGGAAQYPTAPQGGQQMASVDPNAAAPANALDITKQQMVGNWRVANGGSSCDMFLTLTNLGSGSRGGTRGCTGELTAMGSWEVSGKQVLLKDRSGNQIGSVYKTADNSFSGQTNGGQPITLSR